MLVNLSEYEKEYIFYDMYNSKFITKSLIGTVVEEPINPWKDIKVVKSDNYISLECTVKIE